MTWWRHLRAYLGGYFWIPCPRCGRMFGGDEARRGGVIYRPDGTTWSTCRKCPGFHNLGVRP